jgi:hypothetical protein
MIIQIDPQDPDRVVTHSYFLDQAQTKCADIGAIINYSPQVVSPSATTLITFDRVEDLFDLTAITTKEIGTTYQVKVDYTLLTPHTSVISKTFII